MKESDFFILHKPQIAINNKCKLPENNLLYDFKTYSE